MMNSSQGGRTGQASVLASDLVVTGAITAKGTIELHGNVDGEVVADHLMIGNEGRVKGRVQASSVDLRGEMDGALTCKELTLRAAARLNADVVAETLVIESGAEVEGRFARPAPPVAQPAPPPAAPASKPPAAAPATPHDPDDEAASA